jgi:hypothetical protein
MGEASLHPKGGSLANFTPDADQPNSIVTARTRYRII